MNKSLLFGMACVCAMGTSAASDAVGEIKTSVQPKCSHLLCETAQNILKKMDSATTLLDSKLKALGYV